MMRVTTQVRLAGGLQEAGGTHGLRLLHTRRRYWWGPQHGSGPCLPFGPALDLADGRTQFLTSSSVQGAEVSANRWQEGGGGVPSGQEGPGVSSRELLTCPVSCLPGAWGAPSLC